MNGKDSLAATAYATNCRCWVAAAVEVVVHRNFKRFQVDVNVRSDRIVPPTSDPLPLSERCFTEGKAVDDRGEDPELHPGQAHSCEFLRQRLRKPKWFDPVLLRLTVDFVVNLQRKRRLVQGDIHSSVFQS